jgi:hypothetical protein
MLRFYKPARAKENLRGFFSYISESIVNIHNVKLNYPDNDVKVYYVLENIPGYGNGNCFDICFEQDHQDYEKNKESYHNIEEINQLSNLELYNKESFNEKNRKECEIIVKETFTLNQTMTEIFKHRHSQISFEKTIGFHRRATDMQSIHNIQTLDLSYVFGKLEKEDFENIFLMCDNLSDLKKFKERYGRRLITYDEFSTSQEVSLPYFKLNKSQENKIHIQEIVFGAYTLGMTKKLICTKSNLSSFSILSNSRLNYTILN